MPAAPALTAPPALMAATTTATTTSLTSFSPAGGFVSTTFSPLTSCDCCPYLNSLGKFSTMRAHLSNFLYSCTCVCRVFAISSSFFQVFHVVGQSSQNHRLGRSLVRLLSIAFCLRCFQLLKMSQIPIAMSLHFSLQIDTHLFQSLRLWHDGYFGPNCRRHVCDGIFWSHVASHRQRRLAPEIMHLLRQR